MSIDPNWLQMNILTVSIRPPDRIWLIDLAMDGFSATHKTRIPTPETGNTKGRNAEWRTGSQRGRVLAKSRDADFLITASRRGGM